MEQKMQKNHSPIPSKIGDSQNDVTFGSYVERTIQLALKSQKIKTIPENDDESIKMAIRYVFALIGLKPENIPDDLQKAVLINYIRHDLGKFTLDEIKLAFHYAINGYLDVDPNHYQSFSPMYLSQIMQSYDKIRMNVVKKEYELTMEKEKELPFHELKEGQTRYLKTIIGGGWKKFIETGKPNFGYVPINVVYRTLVDDMKIMHINDDEKESYFELATLQCMNEYEKKKSTAFTLDEMRHFRKTNDDIQKHGFKIAMAESIKREYHKIAIEQFFMECHMNEIDIDEKIDKHIQMINFTNKIYPNE